MDLNGAVTVVTGGAHGIGRACALAFAGAGSGVVVADVDDAGAAEAAAAVEAAGGKALGVGVDVSDRAAVEDLVERAVAWQGHLDVFMSNAGVGSQGPPHLIPAEDWEWVLGVNLWPHIWAARAVLPHMLERGSGHLVHTASFAGLVGTPLNAPYVVSKFGVVGLAESLALYGMDKGIGVSVVCPAVVRTDLMDRTRVVVDEGEDRDALVERMYQVASTGLDPDVVAGVVVEAVRENRLYVFPHPEIRMLMEPKWADPQGWMTMMKGAIDALMSS